MTKAAYRRWKQGQATKEECRDIVQTCRDGVRKVKAHLELRDKEKETSRTTRKNFRCFSRNKQGKCAPVLNGLGKLVAANTDEAEPLEFFTSVFSDSVSQAYVFRERVQGHEWQAMGEDKIKHLLRNLDPNLVFGIRWAALRVVRTLTSVIVRLLSIIFERFLRLRETMMTKVR